MTTRWRQRSQNTHFCPDLSSARDTTEMTETEGDLGQSEDEDRPSVEASVGPPEAPEGHEEKKEEPPLREVHTPPAKPPVKLLTRLGSLDSQYQFINCMYNFSSLVQRSVTMK